MSFLKDLQASINYIEENLEGKFDVAEAAAIAYVSKYHYQRMFQLLLGSSVGEYVRKRKMTLAAIDLKNPNEKVIDIALKYGYQSPESFSKAFKRIHGLNPSEVSKKGVSLLAYPKITFQIQIK